MILIIRYVDILIYCACNIRIGRYQSSLYSFQGKFVSFTYYFWSI